MQNIMGVFQLLQLPRPGFRYLCVTLYSALSKQGKKAFGHSAARLLKAKFNKLKCYLCLKIQVENIVRIA